MPTYRNCVVILFLDTQQNKNGSKVLPEHKKELKFIFIKSKQNYNTHTNTQEFGTLSRITDDFRTLEEISCPRGACDRSLFFVRAQRAHPVNRRVGRWALFQMTKIRTAEMITINLENVFQSDRGLYHKYSAKTSVV